MLARPPVRLFLTSFTVLFVELLLIRWIPAYAVFVGFFSNFILMASFLGIGLGILLGSRLERLRMGWLSALLLATVVIVITGQLSLKVAEPEQIFFGLDDAPSTLLNFFALPAIALLTVALMAILAAPLGPLFRSMAPLRAYAVDISGSITGIACFTVLSASGTDPIVWFTVAGILLTLLAIGRGASLKPSLAFVGIAAVFAVLIAQRVLTGDLWSPYYRITVFDAQFRHSLGTLERIVGAPRYIFVSGIGHQQMRTTSEAMADHFYGQIYRWFPDQQFERVLVIGAGSGTDVALALERGSERVVAVEIDPTIAELGRRYHPNHPYSNPRVTEVIEDGRAYLARSNEKFDLVIFALTDSLTLVTGTANVRLESFLFTRESLALARDHLTDDGVFVMYNIYRQPWLVEKLVNMAGETFDQKPLLRLHGPVDAVIAAGPLVAQHGGVPEADALDAPPNDSGPTPRTSTDDWPFLYLRFQAIPGYYLGGLAFLVLIGLGALAWAGRTGTTSIRGFSPHFFALGAAFLLLETRSLVTFSLLFGTTWLVNALAFAAILVSVLLSIGLASRMRHVPKAPLYGLLAASILLAWALPPESLFLNPPALRYVVASVLAFAPVFFANLVFSRSFGETGRADVAFASNLLGAMVGGALEYLSLLTGFRTLGLVALALYGLAWLFERRIRWLGDRAVVETAGSAPIAGRPPPGSEPDALPASLAFLQGGADVSEAFFTEVPGPISFGGLDSTDPLTFKVYEPDRVVLGKPMAEHLRIAVCLWHGFNWPGSDVFGVGTFDRPWLKAGADPMAAARAKLDAAFEFVSKLGVPFYCFHDRDIAPEGSTFTESRSNLQAMVDYAADHMERTGIRLLWGTANLFSHPRYAAGAATNPDPAVFAYAAAQVKVMLEQTHRLGGSNYVLWGGREGYETLLNTDLRREADQLARFLSLVAEHKAKIGFTGTLLIEPKPQEPTKHQYDYDSATVHGFLVRHGLEDEYRVNIEANHATLAGHSFHHDVAYAVANGIFGSIDANRGDYQNGWDTDQFPNSVEEISLALYEILRGGGFENGGFNFDAKLRRQSMDRTDLFHGHIGGIDTLARALLVAADLVESRALESRREARYAGWDGPIGAAIAGGESLAELEARVAAGEVDPAPVSGQQELLENVVNQSIWSVGRD